jgi:putative peptidoglycan lipid II flippase
MRESAVGAVLGASVYMDAFIVAFRIPNLLRELLAEGALGSSFTKVYSSLSATDAVRAEKLLVQFLQFVFCASVVICTVGILEADALVKLLTDAKSSYDDKTTFETAAVALTQFLFPFIGFSALGAVVMGALYQRGGFFLSAVAPILFNVASIIGVFFFGSASEMFVPNGWLTRFGDRAVFGLAAGTLLGGFLQMSWQFMAIWRPLLTGRGLLKFTSIPWSKDIAKVLLLMGPMILAGSAGQVNVVVNSNFATSVGEGAVSWLNYAFRFVQLPIGMFGVAISAAILPALSRTIAKANGIFDKDATNQMQQALELVVWLMTPCVLFIFLCSRDITALLYQAGRFRASDTSATALAMQAYSWGLISYGLLKVLNSFYYAVEKTRYPMVVGLLSIGVNYIGNAVLVREFGHVGLAMTASATLSMNALLLLIGVQKSGFTWNRIWLKSFFAYLCGATLLALIVAGPLHVGFEKLALYDFFSQRMNSTVAVKLSSAISIVFVGAAIVVGFGFVGLRRLGRSPRDAVRLLRRPRSLK